MAANPTKYAVCVLKGDAGVTGVIRFSQNGEHDPIHIEGQITGLKAGQ